MDKNRSFSFVNFLRAESRGGRVDGFEREVIEEAGKLAVEKPSGSLIPFEHLLTPGRRDMTVTDPSTGGGFVQKTVSSSVIEFLRPQTVALRAGAVTMTGLSGNVALPRQTGTVTVSSKAEQETIAASTSSINQPTMTPHRISARTQFSKQLLLQSSPDVEAFIRNDIAAAIGVELDRQLLVGTGAASEITGIANTPGIGTATFGGAATWSKVLEFETSLTTNNVPTGGAVYVVSPATRAKWKSIPKINASTVPIFLYEDFPVPDPFGDGRVNGYRSLCSNQTPSDRVLYGNFKDLVIGIWGGASAGLDVCVDPFSLAEQATVRVIVHLFADCLVRHAKSFCFSTDTGAA